MIFRSPYPTIEIPNIDLSTFILERAKKYGKRIALIDAMSGRQITYSEFYESVLSVARGLHSLGLNGIEDVRIGKSITLQVNAATADQARELAEEASKKLLSNPVMEYFEIHVN